MTSIKPVKPFRTNFTTTSPKSIHSLGGTSYELGTNADGFMPVEILYHKLEVTILPSLDFSYSFMNGSGIRNNANVGQFLADLEDGPPALDKHHLYNTAVDAPNIVVKNSCYVVIELNGVPRLRFESGYRAIDMGVAGVDSEYILLNHIDTGWDSTPKTSSAADSCYLIYFGVSNPLPKASNTNHPFNIYFQLDQITGGTVYVTVDPHIKNRG